MEKKIQLQTDLSMFDEDIFTYFQVQSEENEQNEQNTFISQAMKHGFIEDLHQNSKMDSNIEKDIMFEQNQNYMEQQSTMSEFFSQKSSIGVKEKQQNMFQFQEGKSKKLLKNIKIQLPNPSISNSSDPDTSQEDDSQKSQLQKISVTKKINKKNQQNNNNKDYVTNFKNQKVNLGKKFIGYLQSNKEQIEKFVKVLLNQTQDTDEICHMDISQMKYIYQEYLTKNYNNYNGYQYQRFFQDYITLSQLSCSKFRQKMCTKNINNKNFSSKRKFNQSKEIVIDQLKCGIGQEFVKKNKLNYQREWEIYNQYVKMVNVFNKFNRISLYRYLITSFPVEIFTVPIQRSGFKIKDRESVNEFALTLINEKISNTETFYLGKIKNN